MPLLLASATRDRAATRAFAAADGTTASPSSRPSLDDDADRFAPAFRIRFPAAFSSPGDPAPSSTSISRHRSGSPPSFWPVTRSSATSASSVPSASSSRTTVRLVSSVATGRSSAPRVYAATCPASRAGTTLGRPSEARSSCLPSGPTGIFRCQPASGPPLRRRSVILCAASRRSAVSK